MQFRKKPVIIEAADTSLMISLSRDNWAQLPDWFKAAYDKGDLLILPHSIEIRTLEGTMTANDDDKIICGVKGELYPCKPDIFAATYEPVEPQ